METRYFKTKFILLLIKPIINYLITFSSVPKRPALLLLFVISLKLLPLKAQERFIAGNDVAYYKVSVNFYSTGSGIDLPAMDKLKSFIVKFQQLNDNRVQYETVYWGMEGEQLIYFDLQQLSKEKQIEFTDSLWQLTHTLGTLVKMQMNLFTNEIKKQVCFTLVPFNLLIEQEQKVLDYISAFENEKQIRILSKAIVTNTHIPEDQNLHYFIELAGLNNKDKERFMQHINLLLKTNTLSNVGSR